MDYEKKDSENTAVKTIMRMIANGEISQEVAEKYFPELKESEDEKTKRLLHTIANKMSQHLRDIFTEEEFQCFDAWSNVWLKKQGEQKPVPKFKVGDWVIGRATNNEPRQISEITDQHYKSTYGGQYGFSFEDEMHLWTIQDAKDGDVLCTYECGKPKIVFILKGAPKKPYVLGYYCFYNIMYPHFEFDSEKGCLAPNEEDVKPATKEQRDTLEMAMTNAGYRWDKEKLKLEKI